MHTILEYIHQIFGENPDWKQVFLIGMTPIFLMAVMIEYVVMRRRNGASDFDLKDVVTNLSLGGSYQIVEVIYHFIFLSFAFDFFYQYRLMTIEMNALSWAILMLGMEFSYYWFHRTSHRVRWFWCAHVVHHSGEHMNMTTAMRQSLTYSLNFSTLIFWVPLMLIGFPPAAVMFALAINLAYQFFIHTESMRKWPAWAEFLLNTPSHHRAHHGRNDQYIDKNYGGVLIIWDRLFGTFEPEVEKVDYGVVRGVDSSNLITLNFYEWKEMFKDVMKPGSLSTRLKHLWKGPEWVRPQTEETQLTTDKSSLEATR